MTTLLRGKTIKLTKSSLTICRIFTLKQFNYSLSDIISYTVKLKREPRNDYQILQFETKDGRTHHVLSYELRNYNNILRWLATSGAGKKDFEMNEFLLKEYGVSLLIALVGILGVIVHLIMK